MEKSGVNGDLCNYFGPAPKYLRVFEERGFFFWSLKYYLVFLYLLIVSFFVSSESCSVPDILTCIFY